MAKSTEMAKKLLLLLLLTVIVSSCKNETKSNDAGEVISYINIDANWEMSLDTLVAHTEHILLETTPESLLGNIQVIKTDDSLYFIKDEERVLIFDYNGKFINQVGRLGRGPEEYGYIHDYFLDRINNEVCIIDRTKKKVFKHDYNGRFTQSVELDLGTRQNKFTETDSQGNLIVYFSVKYAGVGNSDYQYSVFNLVDGKYVETNSFLDNIIYSGDRGLGAIAQYPISYSKERVLLLSGASNIIYEYKNGILTPAYSVQTDKAIAEKDFFEENQTTDYFTLLENMKKDNSYFVGLNNIIETSQYVMLLLENSRSLFWDKTNNLGISINSLLNPLTNAYGNTMAGTFSVGNDDHVLGFVNASSILFNRDEVLASTGERFESVISSIDEYSNPVLCRYYLKTDAVKQFFE
jgi:hypothetical protein